MEGAAVHTAGSENTLRAVLDAWLKSVDTLPSFQVRYDLLKPFFAAHGDLRVSQLTVHIVEEFPAPGKCKFHKEHSFLSIDNVYMY
jgi:hypothetical protein